ncbi:MULTISPECIES: hypothetical protein [Bacillus cereus group]|uniref:hypothetical protein n=1 Tax=Bacillus cereus group TaxID=86661 RepID=UPI00027A207B|nr:hypothetical protein [Bacillus cereus]EJR42295.1 hypothetical protein IIE_00014 [Bacillus cereus VD045]HDR4348427.1 hypothetical protein [Bacillus cereus]
MVMSEDVNGSLEKNNVLPVYKYEFFTDVIWIDNWYGTEKKFALISVRRINKESGAIVKVIHPLSEFILSKHGNNDYNTMKKYADNLIAFLNYLHNYAKELDITTLSGLQLSHGNQFLNYLGKEKKVSGKTVHGYERTLTRFYVFLSEKGLLPEVSPEKFVKKENQWGIKYYMSPFNGVVYPPLAEKKKEHIFPIQYFPLLMEISIIVAPRITLGIYMQFMGGLRNGEVVNITRTQAIRRIGNGDFTITVKNRKFRSDIKDHVSSEVKRERSQEIFNIKNWLTTLFEDHKFRFHNTDGGNALFVNSRGKAMTAKSYSQYFNKVKNAFCDYLKEHGDEDDIVVADHLRTVDWSTHIGRGTFTNMVAERTDNPFLLAFKRGDKNPQSALPYIAKTARIRKKIEQTFSNLNNEYMPRLIERRKNNEY